ERQRLLDAYYVPHHKKLKQLVREALETSGHALIIDGHSFPSSPLPCDPDQTQGRPDICLGTDPFHTPEWLADAAERAFREMGWRVERNRPYDGTMVPRSFLHKDARVHSIMVEINRALYLDEDTGQRLPQFGEIACKVQRTVKACILACGNMR
ncbi:MAG TPA: N-formylglutamate amidohydrolase, partial [Anaerolineae bacterium]|nr:N-formylglutamate amidohydrolase [Anaerolineae bacterium]